METNDKKHNEDMGLTDSAETAATNKYFTDPKDMTTEQWVKLLERKDEMLKQMAAYVDNCGDRIQELIKERSDEIDNRTLFPHPSIFWTALQNDRSWEITIPILVIDMLVTFDDEWDRGMLMIYRLMDVMSKIADKDTVHVCDFIDNMKSELIRYSPRMNEIKDSFDSRLYEKEVWPELEDIFRYPAEVTADAEK